LVRVSRRAFNYCTSGYPPVAFKPEIWSFSDYLAVWISSVAHQSFPDDFSFFPGNIPVPKKKETQKKTNGAGLDYRIHPPSFATLTKTCFTQIHMLKPENKSQKVGQ
jgi:hypothetical protein